MRTCFNPVLLRHSTLASYHRHFEILKHPVLIIPEVENFWRFELESIGCLEPLQIFESDVIAQEPKVS